MCPKEAYVRFCGLLTLAEEYFAAGDSMAAVRLAQIAARYAFPANVGLFGSPRLERLLVKVGQQISIDSVRAAGAPSKNSRHVLHVLSYAKPIGGDSRFAWRWIQEDRASRHSVAITTQADVQGIYDVPEVLRKSAENSGGFVRVLKAPTSEPLEQASELRILCQEADIVVLHLYPYDIIPVLALSAVCGSVKVLFVNHADHAFWIGASVAHSVVHLRQQSPHFLQNRRGLCPDKSFILPIPLMHSPPPVSRVQAKRALGYEPNVVLLLTIASPFKYSSPGQIGFLDLVTPVLAKLPQAVLIAVGPKPKGEWRLASIQCDGRLIPLGTRWDNDLLYAAADIYLDSIPFSSITSLLEAGSRGIPLLGYSPPNHELELLGPSAPGLENTIELTGDPKSYRVLLTRLITDAEFRRRSGHDIQKKILTLHTGGNWIQTVHDLYTRVEQNNYRGCLLENNDTFFNTSPLDLALVQLYSGVGFNVRSLIGEYIGSLPYRSRLSITWCLYLKGFELCFLNLLPSPMDTIIRHIGRQAKRILRRLQSL